MSSPSTGFKINNRTRESVFCAITNKTNPSGDISWVEIKPGGSDTWGRSGWEDVQFRDRNSTRKTSLWMNRGAPANVYFDGFDKVLTIVNEYRPPPSFVVKNGWGRSVFCCVSTTSGGNGAWFKLMPGEQETWWRVGWETIAFRDADDTVREGVYVTNQGEQATVEFQGFGKEIVVREAPENYIREEHYAEAVNIADRSFLIQNSRASHPGGLAASVFKVNTLEFMTTGKRTELYDHNQIYTLALLINHLKYGLAEPAMVVAITPSWVKVAAFTCEFDSIVVLGFPAAAIDIVAPGGQRPNVGDRLLVVSQFTYRDGNQGIQGDITPGPLSLNKWYNFHPLVAQFVTEDTMRNQWEERMTSYDENAWGRVWDEWCKWKERHGEQYFRLGAPSKIKEMAVNRPDLTPPSYTP